MIRLISLLTVILIVALILFGLGRQIYLALQAGKRLDTAAEEVSNLQQQNRTLRERYTQAQKYDFIEEIARDKLNLAKSGETLIVIPERAINKVLNAQKQIPEVKLPNWQGWLKLFTH